MKPILILGLGNPLLADDGAGCRVAQALSQRVLPDQVEVIEGGTPGMGLIHLVEGRRRVIIVDAAEMGKPSGEVVRFSPQQVQFGFQEQTLSLHAGGVGEALALACALNLPLPEIVVYGIQPERVEWGLSGSERVMAAEGRVVEAVMHEVGVDHGK